MGRSGRFFSHFSVSTSRISPRCGFCRQRQRLPREVSICAVVAFMSQLLAIARSSRPEHRRCGAKLPIAGSGLFYGVNGGCLGRTAGLRGSGTTKNPRMFVGKHRHRSMGDSLQACWMINRKSDLKTRFRSASMKSTTLNPGRRN